MQSPSGGTTTTTSSVATPPPPAARKKEGAPPSATTTTTTTTRPEPATTTTSTSTSAEATGGWMMSMWSGWNSPPSSSATAPATTEKTTTTTFPVGAAVTKTPSSSKKPTKPSKQQPQVPRHRRRRPGQSHQATTDANNKKKPPLPTTIAYPHKQQQQQDTEDRTSRPTVSVVKSVSPKTTTTRTTTSGTPPSTTTKAVPPTNTVLTRKGKPRLSSSCSSYFQEWTLDAGVLKQQFSFSVGHHPEEVQDYSRAMAGGDSQTLEYDNDEDAFEDILELGEDFDNVQAFYEAYHNQKQALQQRLLLPPPQGSTKSKPGRTGGPPLLQEENQGDETSHGIREPAPDSPPSAAASPSSYMAAAAAAKKQQQQATGGMCTPTFCSPTSVMYSTMSPPRSSSTNQQRQDLDPLERVSEPPLYNPLSAIISKRLFGRSGNDDQDDDDQLEESSILTGDSKRKRKRGSDSATQQQQPQSSLSQRAMRQQYQTPPQVRPPPPPRDLEKEATLAFSSPTSMAARRLGKRGNLWAHRPSHPDQQHQHQQLLSFASMEGEDAPTRATIHCTVPKRRLPPPQTPPNPKIFEQMNQVLQVTPTNPLVDEANAAELRKRRQERERLKKQHEALMARMREDPKAAPRLVSLVQPQIRRYLAQTKYQRQRSSARCIQKQYRKYRHIQRQRQIHCERLKRIAAIASRQALEQHRHQHTWTMTTMERRYHAADIIGRNVLRYYRHTVRARQMAFWNERQRAVGAFEEQQQDWAASLIAQAWLDSRDRRTRQALMYIQQRWAARVIFRVMCRFHVMNRARKQQLAFHQWMAQQRYFAALVIQRVMRYYHHRQNMKRQTAAALIARAWRQQRSRQILNRRVRLGRYRRRGAAAKTIYRAFVHNHAQNVLQRRVQERRASFVITRAFYRFYFVRALKPLLMEHKIQRQEVLDDAARVVTRTISKHAMSRKIAKRQQQDRENAAAIMIQRAFSRFFFLRSMERKIEFSKQRRERARHEAAIVITRAVCHMSFHKRFDRKIKDRKQREEQRRKEAAVILSRAMRHFYFLSYLDRKTAPRRQQREQKEHTSGRVILRFLSTIHFRKTVERRIAIRREQRRQHRASEMMVEGTCTSKLFQHVLERKWTRANPKQRASARIITRAFAQHRFRRVLERRIAERERRKRQAAASVITRVFVHVRSQRILDGKIAQRKQQHLEQSSALVITRAFACLRFRRILSRKIEHRREGQIKKFQSDVEAAAAEIIFRALSYHYARTNVIRRLQRKKHAREQLAARMMERMKKLQRDLFQLPQEGQNDTHTEYEQKQGREGEEKTTPLSSQLHQQNFSLFASERLRQFQMESKRQDQVRSSAKERFRTGVRRKTRMILQRHRQRQQRKQPPIASSQPTNE